MHRLIPAPFTATRLALRAFRHLGTRPIKPGTLIGMEPPSKSPNREVHTVPLDSAALLVPSVVPKQDPVDSTAESAAAAEEEEEVTHDSHPSTSDDDNAGPTEEDWKPCAPEIMMVQRLMNEGVPPLEILNEIAPGLGVEGDVSEEVLWRLIVQLLSEPTPRSKLPQHNSLDDAVSLVRQSSNILVLTGAGISVSCGIPDFRSKEGIYSRLHVDFPDLPDPQSMFDIHYFRRNPRPFFQFAKEIYPGQFKPSLSHRFIRELEVQGKLLRNYTQNIDTLEQVAGMEKVVQCHGSFSTATCCVCKHKCQASDIRDAIFRQEIPRCPECPPESEMGIMKPDIVFFGEDLPDHFHQQMSLDKDTVDLLIVIGSSLKVRPVALIPSSIPPEIPQILIDRQPLSHLRFDIQLLGYCDDILDELLWRLGDPWRAQCSPDKTAPCRVLDQLPSFPPSPTPPPPSELPNSSEAAGGSSPLLASEPSEKRPRTDNAQPCSQEPSQPSGSDESSGKFQATAEAEEEGAEMGIPERREPRNLGSLLQPHSLFYDEPKARTLFHGSVVYESDDETETSSSFSSSSASSPKGAEEAAGNGEEVPDEGEVGEGDGEGLGPAQRNGEEGLADPVNCSSHPGGPTRDEKPLPPQ